ncbi:hypothetical protein [Flavobacterium sp. 3HN19-14]|uniref:hypothetical protein n=1 Tax=Flavobacterium sp. 3HN19-14 TaxID=3448133 RepID=UPI003EDEFA08
MKIRTICFILLLHLLSCNKNEKTSVPKSSAVKIDSIDEIVTDNSLSEMQKDSLCIKYAADKRLRNGENIILRNKLTTNFLMINNLYSLLNYGGTYYGHQQTRLRAEVEKSISELNISDKNQNGNFAKSKKDYLKKWIDFIEKKESENVENKIDKSAAKKRSKEFEEKLDTLQRNIENQFMLNQIIKFEKKYYN